MCGGEGQREILKCGPDPLAMGMNQAPSGTQGWWPEGEATPAAETNFLDAWATRQAT